MNDQVKNKETSDERIRPAWYLAGILAVCCLAIPIWRKTSKAAYFSKSKHAQTDVLIIGMALSEYRRVNGAYPAFRAGSSLRFERFLSPRYLRHVPALDPWGNPYQVETTATSYAAWSNGADGLRDGTWQTSRTVGEECDIVVQNDKYIQYPVGIASPGSQWEPESETVAIRGRCLVSAPLATHR